MLGAEIVALLLACTQQHAQECCLVANARTGYVSQVVVGYTDGFGPRCPIPNLYASAMKDPTERFEYHHTHLEPSALSETDSILQDRNPGMALMCAHTAAGSDCRRRKSIAETRR